MKTRIIVLALLGALVTSACFGAGDDADPAFRGDAASEAPATTAVATSEFGEEGEFFGDEDRAAAPEAPADDAAAGDGLLTNAQEVATTAANLGRSIIFTANLTIEVEDVIAAGAEISNAISGLGGILFGQETSTGEFPRSVLTIKVPPNRFDDALERLGGVGELVSQTVFADDVTERVVDLQSRIQTAEISVERLRTLLEAAVSIEDVVELERELVQRETDLEVLRGQLRTLEDAVALATIVVVLTEPVPEVPEPALEMVQTAYLGHDRGDDCPGSEELTIDEGDELTFCFLITNTGDTPLGEIVVTDFGLDMDDDDPFVVEGDLSVPLAPGDTLILGFETTADPDQFTAPNIEATALDEDGEPLRIPVEIEVQDAFLRIIRDTSLPGFMDGLEAAWGALQRFFGVIVLGAGAAVPFLWVPVLAGALWWWRRRRTTDEA
jgi:hypothetical protein